MRFHFRLDTLLRSRKVERDNAQRAYSDAQNAVQVQLTLIKQMYEEIDRARLVAEQHEASGKAVAGPLVQIDEFIEGQKIRIKRAREKARELMVIAEEKHEILIKKMQEHKVLERLKEKKQIEFKKEQNKRLNAKIDDIVTMRAAQNRDPQGRRRGDL